MMLTPLSNSCYHHSLLRTRISPTSYSKWHGRPPIKTEMQTVKSLCLRPSICTKAPSSSKFCSEAARSYESAHYLQPGRTTFSFCKSRTGSTQQIGQRDRFLGRVRLARLSEDELDDTSLSEENLVRDEASSKLSLHESLSEGVRHEDDQMRWNTENECLLTHGEEEAKKGDNTREMQVEKEEEEEEEEEEEDERAWEKLVSGRAEPGRDDSASRSSETLTPVELVLSSMLQSCSFPSIRAPDPLRTTVSRLSQLRSLSTSLDPTAVDLTELGALLAATKQNCEQFPKVGQDGEVARVDLRKLKLALKHSTLVVSLHMRGPLPEPDYLAETDWPEGQDPAGSAAANQSPSSWWERVVEEKRGPKRLVAFARAYSDTTLTAAIHDLAVAPSLQGLGLGQLVLQRIVKELRIRGILDISILTPDHNCSYFREHGFRPDLTGATTMLYTRTATPQEDEGREDRSPSSGKRLLVPPPLEVPFLLRRPLGEPKGGPPIRLGFPGKI